MTKTEETAVNLMNEYFGDRAANTLQARIFEAKEHERMSPDTILSTERQCFKDMLELVYAVSEAMEALAEICSPRR